MSTLNTNKPTATRLIIGCLICTAIAALVPDAWSPYCALAALGFAITAHVVWTRGLKS